MADGKGAAPSWQANRRSVISGKTLYEELRHLKPYQHHREALRPWDRKLPSTVEQEANRRTLWTTKPPSAELLFFVLVMCLAFTQIPAVVPLLSNLEFVQGFWNDVEKPAVVYHDARVLLAVSVVVHVALGLSLWFIFLAEGFSKHQLELAPIALALLAECVWMDVAFYVGRLDWVLAIFCVILAATVLAMVLLGYYEVSIAALMLVPYLCAAVAMIFYTVAFLNLHGTQLRRPITAPRHALTNNTAPGTV